MAHISGLCAFAADNTPQMVLKGTVTYAQNHKFLELPFDVPAGIHRITVDIRYSDREKETVLNTEVFDPERFRGNSGSNKSHFTIGEADATPSYLPGAILPGKWKLVFAVSNIRPDMTSSYEADIYFDRASDDVSFTDKPLKAEAGWYRGDLHMHTGHSDGTCKSQSGHQVPCPVFVTVEAAARRDLDFIGVSDHNTISQYNSLRELQPYFDQLLFIPDREVTTIQGHANFFGNMRFLNYQYGTAAVPDINTLARNARELGGIFSINHAEAPGGEICRGCRWEPDPPIDMKFVDAVEVFNNGNARGTLSSRHFWEEQLRAGYRPTAIGDSDNHQPQRPLDQIGSIGSPTTVVHASELSVPAILDGIRAGHVFVDLYGSRDRLLEVTASDSRGSAQMGDVLSGSAGDTVKLVVHIVRCQGNQVRVLVDGQQAASLPDEVLMRDDQTVERTWPSDGKRHWLTVEVRDLDGALYLLGNPVYINY